MAPIRSSPQAAKSQDVVARAALGGLCNGGIVLDSVSRIVGFVRQDTSSVVKLGCAIGLNDV
jgi:hypothetical protein